MVCVFFNYLYRMVCIVLQCSAQALTCLSFFFPEHGWQAFPRRQMIKFCVDCQAVFDGAELLLCRLGDYSIPQHH